MIDRYSLSPMKELWTEEAQFRRWLEVEIAVIREYEALGDAPAGSADAALRAAVIDPGRIRQLEAVVDHDVIAFIQCATSAMGDEARWFHKGLTSSDVVDTAWSLAMARAGALVEEELRALLDALLARAEEFRRTPCVGRTHGIHAEPTSFGLRLLGFAAEVERALARVRAATAQASVGKISGAVGNYANIPPEVEARVLARLGLAASKVSTQVVPRDHHAEFLFALAAAGAAIERLALEIRHLQRTEVREAMEPFRKGQRGSSAMPHKKNPILSERLCGMARLLRAHAHAALENVALWHERDISHSAAERVIIPDACLLAHYMARKAAALVRDLVVFPARMEANLRASHSLVFSQRAMLALVESGMAREEAYPMVQALALRAWEEERDFRALLEASDAVRARLGPEAIAEVFSSAPFLAHVDEVFARFGR
jgi:adenylosuccinate lyase